MTLCQPRLVVVITLFAGVVPSRTGVGATTVASGNLGTQTWTAAGSPYLVSGDLNVQPGATLTIQAGTSVQFADGDALAAGNDLTRAELTIMGTLNVTGTPASPVVLEMQAGTVGSWGGIVVASGATGVSITGATLRTAHFAISSAMTSAPLTVTRTTVQGSDDTGISITAGAATLDGVTIEALGNAAPIYALRVANAGAQTVQIQVVNTVIDVGSYNVDIGPGNIMADLSSSTFAGSLLAGVGVNGTGPMVTIRSSIVAGGSDFGVILTGSGSVSATDSDIWGNLINTSGFTPGTGVISADPQFVGATDYHLRASSPCIDVGAVTGSPDHDHDGTSRPLDGDGKNGAAFDMGAYEFNPAAGAGGAAGVGGVGGHGGAAGGAGIGGAAMGGAGGGGSGGAGIGGGRAGGSGGGGVGGGNTAGSGGGGTGGENTGGSGGGGTGGARAGSSGGGGPGAGGLGGSTDAGGTSGASGGSGASGQAGTASSDAGGAAGGRPPTSPDAGGGAPGGSSNAACGCQTGGHPVSVGGLSLVVASLLRRRRRRQARRVGLGFGRDRLPDEAPAGQGHVSRPADAGGAPGPESVEDAPELTDEDEVGIQAAIDSLSVGRGVPLDAAKARIDRILKK